MKQEQQITEVDLEVCIANAIKAKNLKKLLQNRESEIRIRHYAALRSRRITYIRSITSVVAAACLVFGIFHFKNVSSYKSYGDTCYASYKLPISRGADTLLVSAYNNISKEKFITAHAILDRAIESLQSEQYNVSTEEGAYYRQKQLMSINEAQWLKAIIYMKQGKVRKAKMLLRLISNGDGQYKEDAAKILK